MTDKEIVFLIATGMVLPLFRNAIQRMLDLVCKALLKWLGLEERAPVLPSSRQRRRRSNR